MSRGSNTLFSDIFIDQPEETSTQRRGRSAYFHSQRNECLVDRYYYYCKVSEKRYDIVLEKLSVEFFLSTVTIPEIIDSNYEHLVRLKKAAPDAQHFKKKWPHLVWNA